MFFHTSKYPILKLYHNATSTIIHNKKKTEFIVCCPEGTFFASSIPLVRYFVFCMHFVHNNTEFCLNVEYTLHGKQLDIVHRHKTNTYILYSVM